MVLPNYNLASDAFNESGTRVRYINSAKAASDFLTNSLEAGAFSDLSTFITVLNEMGRISSYKSYLVPDTDHMIRKESRHEEDIPNVVVEVAAFLLDELGINDFHFDKNGYKIPIYLGSNAIFLRVEYFEFSRKWRSSINLVGKHDLLLEEIMKETGVVYGSGELSERLDAAINTYYNLLNGWFWDPSNASRCCNYFNVLLDKLGILPVPHGINDFLAYLLPYDAFKKYVLELIKRVSEGVKLV